MAKVGTHETQGTRYAKRDGKDENDFIPPVSEGQESVGTSAMDFDDESSGDEDGGGKVRVKFVTKIPSIRVTETPVAVPETLQRYGLSEVVNHLLGRDPPTPFDMLVMGRFLRSSLQSVMRRHALSGEAVLEVEYLPAIRQPTEAEHADQPDWVSAVAGCGKGLETFVTGCYDGCLRVYGPGCKVVSTAKAHQSPVTGLCAVPAAGGENARGFLSGSKDMTARLWRINASGSNASLEAAAVLRSHSNSISAVHASESVAYTGDWDGQVCMWDLSCLGAYTGSGEVSSKATKRRKTGIDETEAVALSEPSPSATFRGHAQAVTGLAGPGGPQVTTLYSASLDRAVKTWDSERQDCVYTLNAPKAITCLDCSSSGRMLATGHPDARVRIWDTRSKGETLTKTSLSSHVQWITSVAWAPGSETMVLSCAHDGAVKLWDIRSSVPLHSARAHEGKALCCGWEDKRIVSGGADGAVKTYLVPETNIESPLPELVEPPRAKELLSFGRRAVRGYPDTLRTLLMTKGTLDVINRLLRQPLEASNLKILGVAMQQFLVANKDPTATSSVQHVEKVDDLGAILAMLESEELLKNPILVLILKVLKVLMRKQANRWALGRAGVRAVTVLMGSASLFDGLDAMLCECANVVLNMCYDSENVRHFLEVGGMAALAPLIHSDDERLKTSGLGALQSVCFDKPGRRATRDSGMIGVVVRSLDDASPKVRARALGTVHNLSTDASSIGIIRQEGGLPILVRLLRSHDAHTCGGAASTIQNLSREERSRAMLTSFGAVEPLADLLVGRHVKSQRQLLHRVLTDGIVLGMIESCMI